MAVSVTKISTIAGLVPLLLAMAASAPAKFDELFHPNWASDHFLYEGEILKLKLDYYSGTRTALIPSKPLFLNLTRAQTCFLFPFRSRVRFEEQVYVRESHHSDQTGGGRLSRDRNRLLRELTND